MCVVFVLGMAYLIGFWMDAIVHVLFDIVHNVVRHCGDWIFELDIGLASNLHVRGN